MLSFLCLISVIIFEVTSGCNWFSVYTHDLDEARFPLGVCTGSHSDENEAYFSQIFECANNGTHDYVKWTIYDES